MIIYFAEARFGPFDSNGFQAGVKVYVKLDLLPDRKEIEELRRAHITRQGKNSVVKHHDLFHSLAKEDSLSDPCILQRIEPYKTSLH